MATRFAQLTPETIADIQSQLERGHVRDFADLCDRMMQREPDILGPMESRLSVISGSQMLIEPAEPTGDELEDALAVEGADLLRESLSRIPALSQRVHEMLMGIFIGFACHEKVWAEDEFGAMVIVDLLWLHQRRFIYGNDWRLRIVDTGREYVAQGLEMDPDSYVIHEPKVIPGYPTGGALRACMWLYMFKSLAMQFLHAGAEQFAWPTPVGTVGKSAGEEGRAALQEALENFTNGKAVVIDPESTMELLESTVKDGGMGMALIGECNRGFGTALLGMTDLANPSRVGSYAAVVERKGATVDARIFKDERSLSATFEAQIAEPMMRLNKAYFGGRIPRTPRVSWLVPAKRQAIPSDVLATGVVRRDEARASVGLPPIGGAEGAAFVGELRKDTGAPSPGAPATQEDATALNGAQVAALVSVLQQVYAGTLPVAAAKEIVLAAFPTVTEQSIDKMLANPPKLVPVVDSAPADEAVPA